MMLHAILLQKHLAVMFGLLIKLFYMNIFVEICTRWEIITYMRHG